MKNDPKSSRQLTAKEKFTIAAVTAMFAAMGGILGVIAYYQQWLG